jgi:protease-3
MKKLFLISAITVAVLTGCATEPSNLTTSNMQTSEPAVLISPNDDRYYRTLTLPNNLEVMLVSDPGVEKSAAALSVGVGLLFDPMSQQGMAHYLEHMLFLGTERYPDSKGYAEFMTQNGGAHNAYTWLDITNYMFKINNNAYAEGLDRFSDFFKAPKLYPEYTEKEKNAVNAEWSMRREMDYFGQFKLSRAMMGNHPANRFLIGNLESLGDKDGSSLHGETVKFYNTYYSANIMKVAMISNRPLDEMEALAVKYFADIEDKEIAEPTVTATPDFSAIGGKRIHYVPNEDVKQLNIDFTIKDNSDKFAVKPNKYISYLLGSEMPGTPAQQLKAMGLISNLSTDVSPTMYGNYGSLSVNIELTDAGMAHREDIVAVIMQYIELIKKNGVDEKYFSEIKTSLNNQFRFLEKGDEFGYVSNLAAAMQEVPAKYAISSPFYYDHFDAAAINEVLAQLTPETMRVWYISKDEPSDSELHFYDGKYKIDDISAAEIASWSEAPKLALNLPAVNRLLPQDFAIKTTEPKDKPELVIDNENIKVWQYPSELFTDQPRGVLEVYFNSGLPNEDIKANVMQSLWSDIYNLQQSVLATEASIAGMQLSLSDRNGPSLRVSGFTDTQPQLLQEALGSLRVKVTAQGFAQAVDRYVRGIQNQGKQFPFYQAFDAYSALIRTGSFNADKLIAVANSLSPSDLTAYMDKVLSHHQLRVFAFGNYDQESLQSAVRSITAQLPANSESTPYVRSHAWKPTANEKIVWQQDLDVADVAIVDVAVHPEAGYAVQAAGAILKGHFGNIAFDKLRTEEQLAYAVGGTMVKLDDYSGFAMYIQTPVKDVASMQARFDKFKLEYGEILATLSEEEFAKLKASVLVTLKEPAKNLREEVSPLISDWIKENYDFNSKQMLIDAAEKVTLADVKDFYQKTMLNPAAARISVQMRGSKFADKPFANIPGATIVTDLESFHRAMSKQ